MHGQSVTVPATVGESLQQITTGGESGWFFGWFFELLARKCQHSLADGVWVCIGVNTHSATEVHTLKASVSVFCGAALRLQNCNAEFGDLGSVADGLVAFAADVAPLESEQEDDESDLDEEEQPETQAPVSSRSSHRTLYAKYADVWAYRKLMVTCTFFTINHDETHAIMHCPT